MQKEINKLLKRISAEKLKNNNKECIELYNIVAGLYSDIGSYEEAIHYHEKALDISKILGDRLNTAICLRYVGEAKASLGQFFQAIDCIKKYLDLVQREDNKVEIQRAWTTLGRVYLMQAQDMKDNSNVIDNKIKEVAREAEKRFQQALNLAESVREQVGEKEFSQMTSGLLVNIGLIKDICGQHTESVQKFLRAIEICKSAKLREDLFRCQVVLAGIFRQHFKIKMATKVSEEALVTAKLIGKKLLICDAYIERGLVKLCQRDFKEAKRSFAQAYLEKSPREEDHHKAIRLTKLAHLITVTYDRISQNNEANETRMKLCDKLGDLLVAVNCYKLAVEFYKRAFTDARICSRPRNELAKILYSVAETYADDAQYELALVCYEKELKYRNGNDKEQCQSLIKIAHMREYLDQDAEKVCQAYETAFAKAGKDPKLMYNVLEDYVPYMKKKSYNLTRCSTLEETLLNVKSYPDIIAEIEAEAEEDLGIDLEDEVPNIDDVITDDEDNDEVLMVGRRRARVTKKFKPNEVGDTPLHEACIKGDLKRVKLLLEQGHEVNPRDNAGWIPLHEACNHGHYEIAEYLIENGADVNNRGLKGMSPLHDSATNGHYDIMQLLIKNGANVIALTDAGETVLSCLRDFKKRNQSAMHNREITDYKHMEIELMNLMDKCGFNLMDANRSSSRPTTTRSPTLVRPEPKMDMPALYPEDDVLIIEEKNLQNSPPCPSPSPDSFVPADFSRQSPSSIMDDWPTDSHQPSLTRDNTSSRTADMSQELITVLIEHHRLLVPSKNPEYATISWLKDSIAERYAALHGVKPNLSLSPDNDPGCIYYDKDLCQDVIRDYVRATILSWQLEPIAEVYEKSCLKYNLEPYRFIQTECKLIEYKSHLLDMSYTYWPKEHVKPATEAFAWRNFIVADFSGATSMIDTVNDGKDVLESMATWKKVTTISLKCAGLAQCHFENLCSMMKLPELKSLDLSGNGIAYTDKENFKNNVEKLLQGCPRLKRLDMRNNLLKFVKSLPDYASSDFDLATLLSLKPKFDFEILGAEQKDCEIYSQS